MEQIVGWIKEFADCIKTICDELKTTIKRVEINEARFNDFANSIIRTHQDLATTLKINRLVKFRDREGKVIDAKEVDFGLPEAFNELKDLKSRLTKLEDMMDGDHR